jgi:hypothetical protein
LLHDVAPAPLNVPEGHIAVAGVADVDPAEHAYPALQLLHVTAPPLLNVPPEHSTTVLLVAPETGHT